MEHMKLHTLKLNSDETSVLFFACSYPYLNVCKNFVLTYRVHRSWDFILFPQPEKVFVLRLFSEVCFGSPALVPANFLSSLSCETSLLVRRGAA